MYICDIQVAGDPYTNIAFIWYLGVKLYLNKRLIGSLKSCFSIQPNSYLQTEVGFTKETVCKKQI